MSDFHLCNVLVYTVTGIYIEDNQLVIFDMKKSHEDALLGVGKKKCAAQVFLTPYNASERCFSYQK